MQLDKFVRADFKYENSFLKFKPKNTQIKYFGWERIRFFFLFFFFCKILKLEKFECADLKYDNSFFKIQSKKYPNKAFLVSSLSNFLFTKFCNLTNLRVLISNIIIIFLSFSPKYSDKVSFLPSLGVSFSENFWIAQIWVCWFQIWQQFFKILLP